MIRLWRKLRPLPDPPCADCGHEKRTHTYLGTGCLGGWGQGFGCLCHQYEPVWTPEIEAARRARMAAQSEFLRRQWGSSR